MSGHLISKRTFISVLMLLSIFCFGGLAQATPFTDITLGEAGPSGLDLGIFVTGPTKISASNSSTLFDTNIGLSAGAGTNFSGNGTLTGTLYVDPGATVQSNINSQFHVLGGIHTQSLAQAVLDVQNAADFAALLTPTQSYGNINNISKTFTSSGTENVININGNITLTNSSNKLVFSGGLDDFFIVNVLGDIALSGGADILTFGGLPASHLLFNVEGTGDSIKMSNSGSTLTGTFLAPDKGQKITISPGTVNGALIGYCIQTSSGPRINGSPYNPPTRVPEPGTLLLLGSGLAGLAAITRKFRTKCN